MINSIMRKISPSATLAVKTRATELKRAGETVFDLSPGECDFDTPQHIKDAATKALAEGKTRYTAVPGIPELREALADRFTSQISTKTEPANVIVTNGGKQALFEAFAVTIEPGDEVLIPAPYWVSYPEMINIVGGVPRIVHTDESTSWKLTPEALSKALTPKTKWFIINSPSNPTGMGYTKAELAALGEVLEKHDTLIMSDEVYDQIIYPHFEFSSFLQAAPALLDRTVTVNAFSKTYAMTGWRVGYAFGPQELIKAMSKYQGHATSNVNTPSQYAALAAISGPHDFLEGAIKNFTRRLATLSEHLADVPGVHLRMKPDGAFYQFVMFDELAKNSSAPQAKDSKALCQHLIDEVGVAVVPGAAFGEDLGFRVSFAVADETIDKGAALMASAMKKLANS